MGRPACCQSIARSSPQPLSKSTSLSAVTLCYPRQPGKRLWRSNQLWLNTKYDGSHYSKSRTAKALTTIDYLNIACIGYGGFHAHLRHIWLRREEVDCPSVVYWYWLSFMMSRTIFQRKCQNALLFLNFLFLRALLILLYEWYLIFFLFYFLTRLHYHNNKVIWLYILCCDCAVLFPPTTHLNMLGGTFFSSYKKTSGYILLQDIQYMHGTYCYMCSDVIEFQPIKTTPNLNCV